MKSQQMFQEFAATQSGASLQGTRRALPSTDSGSRIDVTLLAVLILLASWALGLGNVAIAQDDGPKPARNAAEDVPPNPFPNRVKASEFDGGIEWLNASGPISLKDVRGKVVLLDFWTYCCINCMHVLPDLKFLEEKYGNQLVVIGVHSAKFDNEKESGNIRGAILRYEIEHPVINDANMEVWQKFGVRAWPTLVLIDPEGFYCGYLSGEGNREVLDQVLGKVIEHHRAKGTLDESPVRFDLERADQQPTPLRFPGKVLADAKGNRLFISDSNHNRIVVTSLDGELQDVIGSGEIGENDGSYAEAQFDHPQGMALVGHTLFVADTENHLLRTVDLQAKKVTTLAGTGEQGHVRGGTHKLKAVGLNSPWDLVVLDDVLYIAMAGPHQLWSHKLGSNAMQPYAGSGREDIRDGSLADSALAQPSGLATDGKFIYVCDSEGSAIRRITTSPAEDLLNPTGKVDTIAGTSDLPNGRSLFAFGDVDGVGGKSRLQHPLGITFVDDRLIVADSYNHKLKQINRKTLKVTTWLGTGKPGAELSPPQFSEPAGLSAANDVLYVADTNNHRICAIDMTSKTMKVLEIPGLEAPPPPEQTDAPEKGQPLIADPQQVQPGLTAEFTIDLTVPEDYKLNPDAAVTYRLSAEGEPGLIAAEHLNTRHEAKIEGQTARFRVPLVGKSGQAVYQLAITYAYCRDGASGLCKLSSVKWQLPLEITAVAQDRTIRLKTPPVK